MFDLVHTRSTLLIIVLEFDEGNQELYIRPCMYI